MPDDRRDRGTTTARSPWRSRLFTLSLLILVGALVVNRGWIVATIHSAVAPPPPSKIIIVAPVDAQTV